MSAAVVPIRSSQGLLTKKQLATAIGRSERWIEMRQREGLPIAETDRFGRRRYSLAAVQQWMREAPKLPRSTADRLAVLEQEVAELRAMIRDQR